MKRTLLLFLLLPFFGFSQIVDLVKWNGPGVDTPTILASSAAVSADNITSGSGSTLAPLEWEGFKGTGWPTNFTTDENRYFQVTASAKTGYKLKLSTFSFTYRGDSNLYVNRYQVRYSKDNFATSNLLIDEATSSGKINKSLNLSAITLYPGETLTLRIYGYKLKSNSDSNSPLFLDNSNTATSTGNTTPTISGTVLPYDASDLNANDDIITTQEKRTIAFDPLTNDSNSTGATITYTQPPASEGTVTNTNNILNFTPATNFKGNTSFTYTLTKGAKTSTATVSVIVTEIVSRFIIWNGAIDQPKAVVTNPNVIGNDISAAGIAFVTNSNPNYFNMSSLQNTNALDLNKYIQVSAKPKPNYKTIFTQFSFIYNSPTGSTGPTKYQVRYSTDVNFTGGGTILQAETTATQGTDTQVTLNFPANTSATSLTDQTFYVRIYPYGVTDAYNGYFKIKHDSGGEVGPTLTGVVDSSNLLAANPDTATTDSKTAIPVAILANDENYNPLTSITSTQPTTGGTVQVNGTTNVTFTPTAGFTGTTTFTYTLFNGTSYASAIVTVTVTAPPCVAVETPGINKWKGYVYTYTGNIPDATTYVGSVAEKANFERNVEYGTITGDPAVEADNFCGPVPAESFLVRYLMQTTTTAATYNFTIGGDDGVRLYIDGALVPLTPTDSWTDHGYIRYAAQYPLTAGSHNFVLEYYEKGGIARVSFSYGAIQGTSASLPFGDNKWNVYGFTLPSIDLETASYAGTYVDPKLNIDTQTYWNKTQSPSYYSGWQGAPIAIDDFAITYKRRGFPCGRYQLDLANCDDVAKILIDGVEIFTQNGYSANNIPVTPGTVYFLNENSTVEVRLREDGGDANVALNFTDTPTVYNGTGTFSPNTTSIKISANTTLNNDVEVCSCTIDPNVVLTVPANKTLTVNQNITIGAGGKLLLQNNGSLLQTSINTDAYTGDFDSFVVQRNTAPVRRYDFTFWSSPVNRNPGYTLHDLSPDTLFDKYYNFNPATGWVISYSGVLSMNQGIGYIVRAPQTYDITTTAIYPATFVGKPNNGTIEITGSTGPINGKSILVGNPYPSAIDANKFIKINHDLGTDVGALYFWTHNSPPSSAVAGDAKYNYTTADYAVYSLTGSVATSKGATTDGYKTAPSGMIASAQAFFIKATSNNKITFTNAMRIGGNNNQFFKTTESNNTDKNRLWLNLTNAQGAFKQALVGYIDGATNNWDTNYDGLSLSGNAYIDFYSIVDTKKLTIQGRALPFDNEDKVPLGYVTTVAGDFTIEIDHADGLFNTQAVYLEDKTTGKITDLRAANYTFTTAIGTFADRFVLSYVNKTLGTGDFENIENGLLVSVKDKVIKVISAKENIKEVTIFDINGKLVYNKKKVGSAELAISNLQSANQVLLVKVTLENEFVVTKKIVFQ